MFFILFLVLFIGLCGWLDSRLPWPKVGAARREERR